MAARQKNRAFRVIVVDSRPGIEGRQLAETLSAEGVPCTYVLLTAISYIMRVSIWFPMFRSKSLAVDSAHILRFAHKPCNCNKSSFSILSVRAGGDEGLLGCVGHDVERDSSFESGHGESVSIKLQPPLPDGPTDSLRNLLYMNPDFQSRKNTLVRQGLGEC